MEQIQMKKYKLLEHGVNGIINNILALLIVKGTPGVGKSWNVINQLNDKSVDYFFINSYTTPLKFYQLLYENRNKRVIIFDDTDGISDNKIKSMLKSACWNITKERTVGYYSTSHKLEDYPSSFQFKANIILICNQIPKGFTPIINRGELIKFYLDFEDKIRLFENIRRIDENKIDEEILDYVKRFCNEKTKNLSIRTLEILTAYKRGGYPWEIHAEEMLNIDYKIILILQGLEEEEWCKQTGMTKRTYYRLKAKISDIEKVTI